MSEITSQYLTFRLAQEQYALEVSQVQEVLEMLPDAPHRLRLLPGKPDTRVPGKVQL